MAADTTGPGSAGERSGSPEPAACRIPQNFAPRRIGVPQNRQLSVAASNLHRQAAKGPADNVLGTWLDNLGNRP
jgi:hypothetical protein